MNNLTILGVVLSLLGICMSFSGAYFLTVANA